jgi:PAS domain S-box-containing protein
MKSDDSAPREPLSRDPEEIRTSEVELRQVVDMIPALVRFWSNLADGSNDFSNQGWQDYTGISSEEARGRGWQAAVHPDDLPNSMKAWREMVAEAKAGEFETRLRRHDGVFRWFLCRIDPLRDESGHVLRWFGTATDIDALKQTEERQREDERERERLEDELRYERDRLRLLLEITNSMTSKLDLRRLVEGLSTSLLRVTRCDFCALVLPDAGSGELRLTILYNPEDASSLRTRARSFLTRSATSLWSFRRNCYASCKSRNSRDSEVTAPTRSTSA